jgi:hypothetical protein
MVALGVGPVALALDLARRDLELRSQAYASGWWLLAAVIGLALFGARKKLPVLPLGSARAWLRVHAFGGVAAVALFGMHVDWRVPDGALEGLVATLFAIVAASGVVGMALSRLLPLRLTTRGESLLFERIPAAREALRREIGDLVVDAAEAGDARLLADFHEHRLVHFLAGPRNVVAHWLDLERPRRRLLAELGALARYASPREREVLDGIAARVRRKDDLDFQHAQQVLLKYWLFAHVPLTWALLVVTAAHVLLALGFRGGGG